jgi:predicted HTH transcriptional regulator
MLTTASLQDLISSGESQYTAFKSAAVRAESLARELVALSNAQGGGLYQYKNTV